MNKKNCLLLLACLAARTILAGDASYEETTKITGGSVLSLVKFAGAFSKDARQLGQPTVTTVSVKGNRMSRVSQDHAEIIDLDQETITNIDKIKHQYSVVTFTQMKQALEQAMEKAKASQDKNPPPSAPAANPNQNPNVDVSFEAHVRETGVAQQISGIDAKEFILTLAMNGKDKTNGQQGSLAVTNDMWMAADLPGYAEVRDFDRKFAAKMGSVMSGVTGGPDFSKLVQQAAAGDAMKSLAKEMASLKGVPVRQVMRMGMTTDGHPLPAASEAPLPAQSGDSVSSEVAKSGTQVAQQTAADEVSSKLGGALGGNLGSAIGGFGHFGRKKKPAPAQDNPAPSQQAPPPTSAVLVESLTEVGKFSQQVDAAALEVPAGYQQIPAPELKHVEQ